MCIIFDVTYAFFLYRGETQNMQYVVWIIKDINALQVYTAPLPPNNLYQYNAYNRGDYWTVATFDTSVTRTLEDLAIAAWVVPQTQARLHPSAGSNMQASSVPTNVAVIVKETPSSNPDLSVFWMYINQLSVGVQNYGASLWSRANGANKHINLQIPGNSSVISTGFFLFCLIVMNTHTHTHTHTPPSPSPQKKTNVII